MTAEDPHELTLNEYQARSASTDIEGESDDPIVPLLGLGGEIGALQAEFKKKRRPDGTAYTGFDEVVVEELGDILWYLASLARRVGVTLDRVAQQNLIKTQARWVPLTGRPPTSFDDDFPAKEKLPRQFDVSFSADDNDVVRVSIFGEEIGDPIDDNARYPDHYRYHDVFHLAYAAVLGWSPVMRSLIGRKRRGDPDVDRVEDGARAYATEEAVAALVFELSKTYDYFDGSKHVDEFILRAVKATSARLEVGSRSASDWERAILTGFGAWRHLRDAKQGTIHVDLDDGTLQFSSSDKIEVREPAD